MNSRTIEILLVEDNPGDARLTLEAFKERMGKQKLSMKQMNGGIKKVTMMNGCNK